jgi:hypothetical protein
MRREAEKFVIPLEVLVEAETPEEARAKVKEALKGTATWEPDPPPVEDEKGEKVAARPQWTCSCGHPPGTHSTAVIYPGPVTGTLGPCTKCDCQRYAPTKSSAKCAVCHRPDRRHDRDHPYIPGTR